ncbi:glycoside hydrolase family 125 protein [Sodiomyces alcalophilus JCM 7366]|uniref:glycoside hydrolase family 125 protein n=1 Tax=Sodiomyces alcalophilus JCM 7366 TaxID=591952 RepID=UPI0039B49CBC
MEFGLSHLPALDAVIGSTLDSSLGLRRLDRLDPFIGLDSELIEGSWNTLISTSSRPSSTQRTAHMAVLNSPAILRLVGSGASSASTSSSVAPFLGRHSRAWPGARPARILSAAAIVAFFVVYLFLGSSFLTIGPYLGSTTDVDLSPNRFAGQSDRMVELHSQVLAKDETDADLWRDEEEEDQRIVPPPAPLPPLHEPRPPPQGQPPAHAPADNDAASDTAPDAASDRASASECVSHERWMKTRPGPASEGKRRFPYMRPPPHCRTFTLPALESLIEEVKTVIHDPDLARLFENAYPMTLDTMVRWRGYANESDPDTGESRRTDQELAYIVTGDIDAMWLRDSASQIYSYLPLLRASSDPDSLASLWRGVINAHARYITISPYCHSFQPPPESGIPPTKNDAYHQNRPIPRYDPAKVFDCKWELDSLASFLQISVAYHDKTGDVDFFQKYGWVDAVDAAVRAAGAMRLGTYADDGKVEHSAWTFTGWTDRGSETLTNDGLGNPTKENGMVRTAFRPSDDATIFQFLVPANMMFAAYLESAAVIMAALDGERAGNLTSTMRDMALGIRRGIDKDAMVTRPGFGDMFAYEVDGFGSTHLMDDANVPSLLAMPLWNYTGVDPARDYHAIYRNTRRFVLSDANPYFMRGPALSAVGGPHVGPGKAWPMAAVVAGLTALEPMAGLDDAETEKEVETQIGMLLDSTSNRGVLHESVNSWNGMDYTRSWFGWPNGLFGELILKMRDYQEGRGQPTDGLLAKSWQ